MTNKVYTDIDQRISDFIYERPEVAAQLLKNAGYKISEKPTLPEITAKMFTGLYQDENKTLKSTLIYAMDKPNYYNFVVAAIGIAVSIAGMAIGASNAKKARELQEKIALAQLSQDKLLAEEKIRAEAETARTGILLTTLEQYRSNLQVQSTQRLKDVWIYTAILASGIALFWGTKELVKTI